MARVELELRNLKREYIMNYLLEAGGRLNGTLRVAGEGWHAWLEEMEPAQVFRYSVPRDMLIIASDDPAILQRIHAFMRQKTMRGGG